MKRPVTVDNEVENVANSPVRKSLRIKMLHADEVPVCKTEKKSRMKRRAVKNLDIKMRRLVSDNLNKNDSIQNFALLIALNLQFVGKVGKACSFDVITNIKSKLSSDQLSTFKSSRFGLYLYIGKDVLSLRLIHSILLREVHHPNIDELWFYYGGQNLRFSLYEFGLVSGLVCGGDESRFSDYSTGGTFFDNFFNDDIKISRSVIESKFKDAVWENDDDAVKFAKLYFVQCFMLGSLDNTLIDSRFIHLLDCPDFDDFPWGKYSFDLFVQSTKNKLWTFLQASKQATFYRLYGFPYAIQFWFYETLTTVPAFLCSLNNAAAYPRFMRWSPKDMRKIQNFDFKVFDDPNEKVISSSNIKATVYELSENIVSGLNDQDSVFKEEEAAAVNTEGDNILEVAKSASMKFVNELKDLVFDSGIEYSDMELGVRKQIYDCIESFETNQLADIFNDKSVKSDNVDSEVHSSDGHEEDNSSDEETESCNYAEEKIRNTKSVDDEREDAYRNEKDYGDESNNDTSSDEYIEHESENVQKVYYSESGKTIVKSNAEHVSDFEIAKIDADVNYHMQPVADDQANAEHVAVLESRIIDAEGNDQIKPAVDDKLNEEHVSALESAKIDSEVNDGVTPVSGDVVSIPTCSRGVSKVYGKQPGFELFVEQDCYFDEVGDQSGFDLVGRGIEVGLKDSCTKNVNKDASEVDTSKPTMLDQLMQDEVDKLADVCSDEFLLTPVDANSEKVDLVVPSNKIPLEKVNESDEIADLAAAESDVSNIVASLSVYIPTEEKLNESAVLAVKPVSPKIADKNDDTVPVAKSRPKLVFKRKAVQVDIPAEFALIERIRNLDSAEKVKSMGLTFTNHCPLLMESVHDMCNQFWLSEFNDWIETNTYRRKHPTNEIYYPREKILRPGFRLGGEEITIKDFFHILNTPGGYLESSHIDCLFTYLRKKCIFLNNSYSVCGNWFDQYVQNGYRLYLENQNVTDLPQFDAIYTFIVGEDGLYKRAWGDLKNLLYDEPLREAMTAYSTLLPLILNYVGFYDRTDINFNSVHYVGKKTTDPFAVAFMDDLPVQENSDCGVYATAFAEYLIEGKRIPKALRIKQICNRYAVNLFMYVRWKNKSGYVSD
ncbi:uncharacterized protein LOC126668359 [Mercurialis annua]|uniref:uncharacterized protein LOC126668359 n=1 Tax=Mercurialis annua TaxID=3986 RepID=UPI0024AED1B0|nr:uncharacterized protein LOC126668359 [Mercurialis annua]